MFSNVNQTALADEVNLKIMMSTNNSKKQRPSTKKYSEMSYRRMENMGSSMEDEDRQTGLTTSQPTRWKYLRMSMRK
jgi:hypothetical protein